MRLSLAPLLRVVHASTGLEDRISTLLLLVLIGCNWITRPIALCVIQLRRARSKGGVVELVAAEPAALAAHVWRQAHCPGGTNFSPATCFPTSTLFGWKKVHAARYILAS